MKKMSALLLATITLLFSCKKDDDDKSAILKGNEVNVHGGKAWTWVQLNKQGNPEKMAVAINAAALNSLPLGNGEGGDHGGHPDQTGNMWKLDFHPAAKVSPFNHVALDWVSQGHPPVEIYGLPHFDFHFYLSSKAEVAAIPPFEVDSTGFKNFPAPEYLPANYINPGGGVPMMGAHWIDMTSPELGGQTFTQTFLYGSYNGKVTFYEPMITLAFLKSTPNFTRSIPQPAKVQVSGYYPTKMRVKTENGVTNVIVEDMVYRTKS